MASTPFSKLDLELRSSFVHDEDTARDIEWVSGYGYLSGGTSFTGRSVDLAVSVCEGLFKDLGYHSDEVWLGYGINTRNEFKYAAIVRHGEELYELGMVEQGGYVNAYGRPYREPREVSVSDVVYEKMYRFDLGVFIGRADAEWPIRNTSLLTWDDDEITGPSEKSVIHSEGDLDYREDVTEKFIEKYEDIMREDAMVDMKNGGLVYPMSSQAKPCPNKRTLFDKGYDLMVSDKAFTAFMTLCGIFLIAGMAYIF